MAIDIEIFQERGTSGGAPYLAKLVKICLLDPTFWIAADHLPQT